MARRDRVTDQVNDVRSRLVPDHVVQALAPDIPLQALRAHLHRRRYDTERVKFEAARAHVAVETRSAYGGHFTENNIRVFWPDGTVDRLSERDVTGKTWTSAGGTP